MIDSFGFPRLTEFLFCLGGDLQFIHFGDHTSSVQLDSLNCDVMCVCFFGLEVSSATNFPKWLIKAFEDQ